MYIYILKYNIIYHQEFTKTYYRDASLDMDTIYFNLQKYENNFKKKNLPTHSYRTYL